MQYSALLVAVMATFAAAAPKAAPGGYGCTPATYACDGKYAWKVCNTQGQWVVSLSPNLTTPISLLFSSMENRSLRSMTIHV